MSLDLFHYENTLSSRVSKDLVCSFKQSNKENLNVLLVFCSNLMVVMQCLFIFHWLELNFMSPPKYQWSRKKRKSMLLRPTSQPKSFASSSIYSIFSIQLFLRFSEEIDSLRCDITCCWSWQIRKNEFLSAFLSLNICYLKVMQRNVISLSEISSLPHSRLFESETN